MRIFSLTFYIQTYITQAWQKKIQKAESSGKVTPRKRFGHGLRTYDKTSAATSDAWKTRSNRSIANRWVKCCQVFTKLRDRDKDFWYRLLYWLNSGWIYVLHCFQKKTNQTSKGDIGLAKERLKQVKARKDEPFAKEEEKSA